MTHPYREPSSPRASGCPRCQVSLIEERIDERTLSRCDRCYGLWLPRDLFLDALIEPGLQEALQAIDRPASGAVDASKSLACPACRAAMKRGNYARTSGVVVDVCPPHGVWLDPSEITRILRFSNANVPHESAAESDPTSAPLTPAELHFLLFPKDMSFWDRLGKVLNSTARWDWGHRKR